MLDQARERAAGSGISNVTWRQGDVTSLPFSDGSFSVVFSRYAFHHFADPARILAEMARVCTPGGKVTIVDVYTTSPQQQDAYDRIEKLRDPSHVKGLRIDEMTALIAAAGLQIIRQTPYRLEMGLEALLNSSFPNPDDDEKVRELMRADIGRI